MQKTTHFCETLNRKWLKGKHNTNIWNKTIVTCYCYINTITLLPWWCSLNVNWALYCATKRNNTEKWTKNIHTAETWYTPKKIWKYVLLWKRNTIVNISRGLGESNKDSHKRYSHTEKKERKTSDNINSKMFKDKIEMQNTQYFLM